MLSKQYIDVIRNTLDEIESTQGEAIEEAGRLLADTVEAGKTIFSFGCSHSQILMLELFYRAGGLMLVNPIFAPGLSMDVEPVTMTTHLERLHGYAEVVLKDHPLGEGDTLIAISTSGRNPVPVEMCIEARERGARVIAVTSTGYSKSVESRHESGKRVMDLADIVLDNGAAPGDAAVRVEGLEQRMGPTSTVGGAVVLQCAVIEAVGRLIERGTVPPVFVSANLDRGDEANRELLERYRDRIHYL